MSPSYTFKYKNEVFPITTYVFKKGSYREYLILEENINIICSSVAMAESRISPFTKILHGKRYFSEPKIYIQAYKAIDKAKGLEFAKWVFDVLMPDLRLKNQNLDLPSIPSTYVINDVQQQRVLNLDDQASSSSSRATNTVTVEESIVVAESNMPALDEPTISDAPETGPVNVNYYPSEYYDENGFERHFIGSDAGEDRFKICLINKITALFKRCHNAKETISENILRDFGMLQIICQICTELRNASDMCYNLGCSHAQCIICTLKMSPAAPCSFCKLSTHCYIMLENLKNDRGTCSLDLFTFKIIVKDSAFYNELKKHVYTNEDLLRSLSLVLPTEFSF